jgi:tetratricopeptide (TPR) repeat protein
MKLASLVVAIAMLATAPRLGIADPADTPPPWPEWNPPRTPVQQLIHDGVLAYVKGDAKTALRLLLKAKTMKPSYAPTHRMLARLYVALGNKPAAKRAYETYLRLAPNAADASLVREQLRTLEGRTTKPLGTGLGDVCEPSEVR